MSTVKGNPRLNFFDQNPGWDLKTECDLLIQKEGRDRASDIMWSAHMMKDPKSAFFRIPPSERKLEIQSAYNVDVDQYEDVCVFYVRFSLSKEARMYAIHVEKLEDLTLHLEGLNLSVDKEAEKYLKIMDKIGKIWDALDKVRKRMIDEETKGETREGTRRSHREKRGDQ